jgi:hypothetical protein
MQAGHSSIPNSTKSLFYGSPHTKKPKWDRWHSPSMSRPPQMQSVTAYDFCSVKAWRIFETVESTSPTKYSKAHLKFSTNTAARSIDRNSIFLRATQQVASNSPTTPTASSLKGSPNSTAVQPSPKFPLNLVLPIEARKTSSFPI